MELIDVSNERFADKSSPLILEDFLVRMETAVSEISLEVQNLLHQWKCTGGFEPLKELFSLF
jgi:hypothetical protein